MRIFQRVLIYKSILSLNMFLTVIRCLLLWTVETQVSMSERPFFSFGTQVSIIYQTSYKLATSAEVWCGFIPMHNKTNCLTVKKVNSIFHKHQE